MTKLPKVRRGTPSSKNGTAIPQISPQMISTGFPFKDISYFLKMETNTDLPNAIRESIKSLFQVAFRVQIRTSRKICSYRLS